MPKESFEQATLKTLKKILKMDNVRIKVTRNEAREIDMFYVEVDGKTVFYVSAMGVMQLFIDGKKQQWSFDSIKELSDACRKVYKEREVGDKAKQEEQKITDFLAGVLAKGKDL